MKGPQENGRERGDGHAPALTRLSCKGRVAATQVPTCPNSATRLQPSQQGSLGIWSSFQKGNHGKHRALPRPQGGPERTFPPTSHEEAQETEAKIFSRVRTWMHENIGSDLLRTLKYYQVMVLCLVKFGGTFNSPQSTRCTPRVLTA